MNSAVLVAYAAALLLAVTTPGPATLAVVSTAMAKNARRANLLACGIAAGDVLLAAIALSGLAALALTVGWAFSLVKYLGAAYLVILGIRMWRTAAAQPSPRPAADGLRAFGLGLAVALGNPKAILFHASLMPLILDVTALKTAEITAVLVIVAGINLVVMIAYGTFAGRAAGWFRTPARMRWVSRMAGGAMVGTGALVSVS